MCDIKPGQRVRVIKGAKVNCTIPKHKTYTTKYNKVVIVRDIWKNDNKLFVVWIGYRGYRHTTQLLNCEEITL